VTEPLSDERLVKIRDADAKWSGILRGGAIDHRRELLAEVDRLRAALDFAERAAADRLGEDERWLAGWKAAREQAVLATAMTLHAPMGYCSCRACQAASDTIKAIREMQP
jgi:hypothetical protein